MEEKTHFLKHPMTYIVLGSPLIAIFLEILYPIKKPIHHEKSIQKDFVKLSDLEIKCEDINNDGIKETIIKMGDFEYLLKYDEKGKPTLYDFKKETKKIIPEEEPQNSNWNKKYNQNTQKLQQETIYNKKRQHKVQHKGK